MTQIRGNLLHQSTPIPIDLKFSSRENIHMEKHPCVYIMTNRFRGTVYVGVTSNLFQRVWQHRNHAVQGFTKKYNLTRLAYYELHDDMYEAICREKAIKKWSRTWKVELIEGKNPTWKDLWFEILGG